MCVVILQKIEFMPTFHQLRVAALDRLTSKAVRVHFEIPEALKPVFQYNSGQYITLKADIQGEEVRRAYSLCSSPSEANLAVGVKEVTNGRFSTFVNRELQAGDVMEVSEPEGRFTFDPMHASGALFGVAAGSGITPLLSIAKTAVANNTPFVLVYGNKTAEDTMFAEELAKLKAAYPELFHLHQMFSQEAVENSRFGRIDAGFIKWALKQHQEYTFQSLYLCGPEPLIELSQKTLKDAGYAEEQIKFELFTSSSTTPEEATADLAEGQVAYSVLLDGETHQFTADSKNLVLDAVLAENVDAPYSCQGGICSSCIARVTEGKTEMVKNQILTDGEVAEGLVLTCQTKVLSAKISLDYDDV